MAEIVSTYTGGATAYVGARVFVEGEIRLRGVLVDPTLLIFYAAAPSGRHVQISFPDDAITKRDVGLYDANILLDEPGVWGFRWEGSGIVDAVGEVTLTVVASSVS